MTEKPTHTAQDTLLFIKEAHGLDCCLDLILNRFADDDGEIKDPDISDLYCMIRHAVHMINAEVNALNIPYNSRYSNGVQRHSVHHLPGREPGTDKVYLMPAKYVNNPRTGLHF